MKTLKKSGTTQITSKPEKRSAGILLHITSLPSAFGIGDIGPQAKAFADFLYRSKQSYWQLLPLGPIEGSQSYSPYSSNSSTAGNTLLISPELLRDDGLLTDADLRRARIKNSGKVRYADVVIIKNKLFDGAFARFKNQTTSALSRQFEMFCEEEASWLNDFSLYTLLKELHGKPWYEWPEEARLRDHKKLEEASVKNALELERIKWLQFIFTRQWEQLRFYCNQLNISLYGDLPFYVSYDSADVWAAPEYFALDEHKTLKSVAGVPPDYFNADGQLWGMPVFNWPKLKVDKFDWWVRRLKKNIELFDVLRLDHFRAFADYWEVDAQDKNARNGRWVPGPGEEFFHVVQKQLGSLPFIAEDLGDINEKVYQLRDAFNFPGMKVLQFAFGDNLGKSDYIPHHYSNNFVVYTGTHDNNTTVGWFRKDINAGVRSALSNYFGRRINEGNVHIELSRCAYQSVAKMAIIPMQDVLGLDESARMNRPASVEKNWIWRLRDEVSFPKIEARLKLWAELYDRY
jgi:4-alpha-glucanotransferase